MNFASKTTLIQGHQFKLGRHELSLQQLWPSKFNHDVDVSTTHGWRRGSAKH